MNKKITILTTLILTLPTLNFAQDRNEPWPYKKKAVFERKVIPHRYSREASAKYHRRIQRVIDVREKQNLPMQWPQNPFHYVIYGAATEPDFRGGTVTAYASDSLDFGRSYTRAEIEDRGTDSLLVPMLRPDGSQYDTMIGVELEIDQIKKYRIMEDWVFDNNYSDFRPTIVAIAPIFELKTSGISIGEAALFWVKMEEFRPVLAKWEIFNPYNNAARLSFDDWFEMRLFASYIVKESNVWDYDLKYYPDNEDNPFAALLNSEAIKNDLFVFEHDLWEF